MPALAARWCWYIEAAAMPVQPVLMRTATENAGQVDSETSRELSQWEVWIIVRN